MESQPQNPEFRINPENFHPCETYPELVIFSCWTFLDKCSVVGSYVSVVGILKKRKQGQ